MPNRAVEMDAVALVQHHWITVFDEGSDLSGHHNQEFLSRVTHEFLEIDALVRLERSHHRDHRLLPDGLKRHLVHIVAGFLPLELPLASYCEAAWSGVGARIRFQRFASMRRGSALVRGPIKDRAPLIG
jgi:hypothetical protein